jgi:hypothetical protein
MPCDMGHFGGLAVSGCILVAFAFVYVLAAWIRESAVKSDPWSEEVQPSIDSPEASEICPHCSMPQEPSAWFCPHATALSGRITNCMPCVNCFSEGEVFRNGVTDRFPRNVLIVCGYLLLSFSYLIFAPIYWFFFFKNLKQQRGQSNMPAST